MMVVLGEILVKVWFLVLGDFLWVVILYLGIIILLVKCEVFCCGVGWYWIFGFVDGVVVICLEIWFLEFI